MRLSRLIASVLVATATLTTTTAAFAEENCTADKKKAMCDEKVVKSKVESACKILAEKGKDGLADIKKDRFDCCGEPDYVWVNDLHPKMIMHPI